MSELSKIGSSKISLHNSGQINLSTSAPSSGTYCNKAGRETWKLNGIVYLKDNDGIYRDQYGNTISEKEGKQYE